MDTQNRHLHRRRYKWAVLAAVSLASACTFPGHTYGWAFVLNAIEREARISGETSCVLWGIALIAAAASLPFVGRLVDQLGDRRSMLLFGIPFAMSVASVGVVVHNEATLLLAFFIIRLLGPGAMIVVCSSALNRWFDERRGVASLLFSATGMLQIALQGPLQALVATRGWRRAFPPIGGCVLVGIVAAICGMRDAPPSSVAAGAAVVAGATSADAKSDANDFTKDNGDENEAAAAVVVARQDAGAAAVASVVARRLSFTLTEAVCTRIFWSVTLGNLTIELLWCSLNFRIVDTLFRTPAALDSSAAADVQRVASLAGVASTFATGFAFDFVASSQRHKLLALALLAGCGSIGFLLQCTTLARARVFGALLGVMMGANDVCITGLYAHIFGPEHIGKIYGVVRAVQTLAVGCGPLLLVVSRSATAGQPILLLVPLAAVMAVAAVGLVTSRFPVRAVRERSPRNMRQVEHAVDR